MSQARFLLDVKEDPAAALTAAIENWSNQREAADSIILLRAAKAANDKNVFSATQTWLAGKKTETFGSKGSPNYEAAVK